MTTSSTTPASEMRQLQNYLEALHDEAAILRHCLGLQDLSNAPPVAKNMIVVAFDTEAWVWDSSQLTEIGFCVFDSRELRQHNDAGSYGENLLKGMYWYHVRIQPNCHLVNREPFLRGDPDTNRYGTTRFLTIPEVRDFLTELFGWKIDASRPELGYCPVVVLGHALNNDLPKLRQAVGFDYTQLGTVVMTIDTQNLVASTGFWRGQPISLENLSGRLGFEYRDPHTACNDIGLTVVAAVQLSLPPASKMDQPKSLQAVVDGIESCSQTSQWTHGSATYCIRCNKRGHMRRNCHAKIEPCKHCLASPAHSKIARTHESHKCLRMLKLQARSSRAAVAAAFRPLNIGSNI